MTWRLLSAVVVAWTLVGPVRPTAQTKNPLEGNPDAIRAGMGRFRLRCADCHGMDGRGVRGPDITQVWARAGPTRACSRRSAAACPDTEMPAFTAPRTSDREVWQMLAYLRTLAAPAPTDPPRGNAENGEKVFRAHVRRCHRVNGTGGRLGPDLSRIGTARSRDVMVGAHPPRRRGFPRRLRAGHGDAARRPADSGREEERRSVLGADHGHARADPGLREGQDEGGGERQAVGDAGVRPRSAERQRSRRSACATCRRCADSIRRSSSNRRRMRHTTFRLVCGSCCSSASARPRCSPSRRRRRALVTIAGDCSTACRRTARAG